LVGEVRLQRLDGERTDRQQPIVTRFADLRQRVHGPSEVALQTVERAGQEPMCDRCGVECGPYDIQLALRLRTLGAVRIEPGVVRPRPNLVRHRGTDDAPHRFDGGQRSAHRLELGGRCDDEPHFVAIGGGILPHVPRETPQYERGAVAVAPYHVVVVDGHAVTRVKGTLLHPPAIATG
jgi:hypothetical protein